MTERVLNGLAVVAFGLRLCIALVAILLALPSLGLLWIYAKLGGE